jgi:hypothetical protein
LDLEYHCESASVQTDGTGGHVSSPATKRTMESRAENVGFPSFLRESVGGEERINGYKALASNQFAAINQVIFFAAVGAPSS